MARLQCVITCVILTLNAAGAQAGYSVLLDDQLRDPLSGNAVLGGVAITMQAALALQSPW